MTEGKKISFGFSKLSKKPVIVPSKLNETKTNEKEVDLIDCFEGNTLKLKNPTQSENKVLVIPLKKQPDTIGIEGSVQNNLSGSSIPLSQHDDLNNISSSKSRDSQSLINDEKQSTPSESMLSQSMTLEEIAAKEILEELNKKHVKEEARIFSVPLTNNPPEGEKESSLEDYENIPVNDFGMAMLRGMGWTPGKGIGKNEKLVTPSLPTLRPKGMGLGADKVMKKPVECKVDGKNLEMVKGSFIRVVAGPNKNCYGQIEGFDDESGRLIVKLALKNVSISLNEFMVQLVDQNEFLKNSKVINVAKYEKYKDNEMKNESEELKFKKDTFKRIKSEKNEPSDKTHRHRSSSSETELSFKMNKDVKEKSSSRRRSKSTEKYRRQRSSSCSSSKDSKQDKSISLSERKTSSSKKMKNRQERSKSREKSSRHYRSSSQSSSSSEYSRKRQSRTKKKKPSSHRHYSRSHSRSPKRHKKHKKSKKYN